MKKLYKSIQNQIASNRGKNLFFDGYNNSFKFIKETFQTIEHLGNIDEDVENLLVNYTTDKVLSEFWKINQYYTFDIEAKQQLRKIYSNLFFEIKERNLPLEELSNNHYQNLKQWLQNTNPFAEKIYHPEMETVESVTCAEYSAEFQLRILQIDTKKIVSPVLDIGCGQHGSLIKYLRTNGIEASGFDRLSFNHEFLATSDWLDFDYGSNKWGTIISNLGFSNHFNHHHLREDGNYLGYATTYMNILNSLKIGGSFHYAPDLTFIEQYLDNSRYQVSVNIIDNYNHKSVTITRLI